MTPIHDLEDFPHFLDVQIKGISSRQELERGYAAFSAVRDGLAGLNNSVVFQPGGVRWQKKSTNLIELFHIQRANVERVLSSLSRAFSLLLARPPLVSTTSWPNREQFTCEKSLSLDLALYETLSRTVQLQKSNWLAPTTPLTIEQAWTPQLQSQLETMLATMTANGDSFNATEIRIKKQSENYRLVMQSVFTQREDTLALLPSLTGYLQSLNDRLEDYLLLLSSCAQHATSAKSLAYRSCPEHLQPSTFENYQIETLSCRATSSQISVSMRLHQESLFFPQGTFQEMMLASATFSGISTLITYSYLLVKLIQYLRKPKTRNFPGYGRHLNYSRVNNTSSNRPISPTDKSAQTQTAPPSYSSSAPGPEQFEAENGRRNSAKTNTTRR